MKKLMSFVLASVCVLGLFGCGNQSPERFKTIETDLRTYYEMSDGTWECDGYTYKYRLELSGRMPNAAKDTTYVYLSDIENISFQKAMMASGLSSNMEDYFAIEEAVLVELK